MPASLDFGAVFSPGTNADLFYPFSLTPGPDRMGNTMAIMGRLKPGATLERAQAEAEIPGNQIAAGIVDPGERGRSAAVSATAELAVDRLRGFVRGSSGVWRDPGGCSLDGFDCLCAGTERGEPALRACDL